MTDINTDVSFPVLTAEHIARLPSALFALAPLLSTNTISFNPYRAAWIVLLYDARANGLLSFADSTTVPLSESEIAHWRATLATEARHIVEELSL